MMNLRKLFIAAFSVLCAGLFFSCMDLYDGNEVQTTFTVTFDGNGGETKDGKTSDTQKFDYGETKHLKNVNFLRENYYCLGWNEKKDAVTATYAKGAEITVKSDITLYAIWSEISITFDGNGGSYIDEEGSEITQTKQGFSSDEIQPLNPNPFSKDGCGFIGWAESPDADEAKYADKEKISITESKVLYAVWGKNHTITFKGNGGTYDSKDEYIQTFIETVPQKLEDNKFIRTGFNFVGWNKNADATTADPDYADDKSITFNPDSAENITLYAIWSEIAITFDGNGGSYIDEEGSEITQTKQGFSSGEIQALTPNPFSKDGCGFIGWAESPDADEAKYTDKEKISITESKVLYAVWGILHTVTFDGNGGTYTDSEGASHNEYSQFFIETVPQKLADNQFKYSGYGFMGWNTDPYATEPDNVNYPLDVEIMFTSSSASTVTLYAIWKQNDCIVTFYGNGGSYTDEEGNIITETTQGFSSGVSKTLDPNPFRKLNAGFIGWGESADATTVKYTDRQSISISTDEKLYALWGEEVSLILDGNGGSYTTQTGETRTQAEHIFVTGKETEIPENPFTKTGHTFNKWNTKKDGTGTSYSKLEKITISETTTLYAQWTPINYKVIYADGVENEDITVPAEGSCDYGQTYQVLFAPIGERDGYTFIGWVDGSKLYTESGTKSFVMPDGNITLIAQWQENIIPGGGITTTTEEIHKATVSLNASVGTISKASASSITLNVTEGFTTYSWYVNGTASSEITGSDGTYTWDITSVNPGRYCVMVEVTDSEGKYSDSIYIVITD